jgi:hypothetical protein
MCRLVGSRWRSRTMRGATSPKRLVLSTTGVVVVVEVIVGVH